MIPAKAAAAGRVERLGAKIYLLWAGVSLGVAFLATPAKFLAPSLTLPVALEVGQQTFRIYNGVELALLVLLLILGAGAKRRTHWYLAALVPGAVILAQALWLIPSLDLRVVAIQSGTPPLPLSNLHTVYVVLEALKVLWLLALGLGDVVSTANESSAPGARRLTSRSIVGGQWRP